MSDESIRIAIARVLEQWQSEQSEHLAEHDSAETACARLASAERAAMLRDHIDDIKSAIAATRTTSDLYDAHGNARHAPAQTARYSSPVEQTEPAERKLAR